MSGAVRKVLEKIFLKSITVGGRSINLYAATKTLDWERPTEIAEKITEPFEESILANPSSIPEGTVEIIARETEHSSEADSKRHFTAVCVDENNKAESKHFYR